MNGKDGKPYKTRDGGVMRLEDLIKIVSDAVYDKIVAKYDTSFNKSIFIKRDHPADIIRYDPGTTFRSG